MPDQLFEIALRQYFAIDVVAGRFVSCKPALAALLGKIFLLDNAQIARMSALINDERIAGIATDAQYRRFRRIEQYLEETGAAETIDADIEDALDLKGEAFAAAGQCGLSTDPYASLSTVLARLNAAAERGVILGQCVLGLLLLEGIVCGAEPERGFAHLRHAADWNNEEALFALLYFGDTRPALRTRLLSRLRATGKPAAAARVEAVYGPADGTGAKEFALLEDAFAQGIVRRELYAKSYDRLLYSKILEQRDKEDLMITPNQQLFSEASALPLALAAADAAFDAAPIASVRKGHAEEVRKVARAVRNADLCTEASYRPLCIASDSAFMRELYADAIAACFGAAHVDRIEVADLNGSDLTPTRDHIFIRRCDENACNVYLLFFCGCEGAVVDAVKPFLSSDGRRQFHLNTPSLSLDLRAILPVCICDKQNARRLADRCEVVQIADPSRSEKQAFARRIVENASARYGVAVSDADAVVEAVAALSIDAAADTLTKAVRDLRGGKEPLTAEALAPYLAECGEQRSKFGFGGSGDEIR